MPNEKTVNTIKLILETTSIQVAWEHLCGFMESFGFDRMMYGRTHFADGYNLGDEQDYMVLSNHDADYFDFFIRSGRFKHSPFFIWTFTNTGFISWSKLGELNLHEKVKTQALKIAELNAGYGVTAGITASFPNALVGQKSKATMCAKRGLTQEDVDKIWEKNHSFIELVWTAFDVKAKSLPFPSLGKRLTPRQKEVLSWIAKGKSNRDAADIMGISLATIEKHLRLAKESLNVATTAQAIAKLSFLNQLIVDTDNETMLRNHST